MLFNRKIYLFIILLFTSAFIFSGCTTDSSIAGSSINHNPKYSVKDMLVHFIDVGQGDSTLVQINDMNLLIDAGPLESEEKVLFYLKSQGVNRLDYIIATHPHEDHIGGMAQVIKKFRVGDFYSPRITENTEAFEDMVNALKRKKLKIKVAKPGVSLYLGKDVSCEILAPVNAEYEDINNYSAVVKITYGSNKLLLTGDAEKLSEREMLQSGKDLSADIIKIGHHGSISSSSKDMLDNVSPQIAVISSGKGNSYGHPHRETLSELNKRKITVYRTDTEGNILLISNGKDIIKE